MKHRILTLVLALALLLGLVCATGITASAEESTQPVTEYGVWVAGVQFTSENTVIDASDFNGKGGITISGTATYIPDENTIEFKNLKIDSEIWATVEQSVGSAIDINYNAIVYSSKA